MPNATGTVYQGAIEAPRDGNIGEGF